MKMGVYNGVMKTKTMDNLTKLSNEAKKMITEMKNKGQCEACMQQVIKALSIIKDNHCADACSRNKEYRCYEFHNQKLEKKIRELLGAKK